MLKGNPFRHLFARDAKLLEFPAKARAVIQIQRLQKILETKQTFIIKLLQQIKINEPVLIKIRQNTGTLH